MSLHEVKFTYQGFEIASLFKVEGVARELVHHEIPDELFASGVCLPALDALADEAADREGIPT